MLHTFWSVKGGSGVTVTSAIFAAGLARCEGPTLLVDLCGDQPAALGVAEPAGAGWTDWLATPDGSPAALARLTVPVVDQLSLLPVGSAHEWPAERVGDLVATLSALPRVVVDAGAVDGGAVDAGAVDGLLRALLAAGRSTLVLRPCYLALRRAMRVEGVDDVVVLEEPERALSAADVAEVLGLPLMASFHVDPAVARSVDSGLLVRRPHRSVERAMRPAS